ALKLIDATAKSTAANPFAPPPTLGKAGVSTWKSVMAQYMVEDAGGVTLLAQLCETLDNIASYDAIIDAEGVMIRTKTGTKAHPLLKERLSARAFVARTIQRLGLNIEVVRPTSGRPPGQSYPTWEDDWYYWIRLLFQPIVIWWSLYVGGVTNWPIERHSPTISRP